MSEIRVTTKKVLMEHIERDWRSVNELLDSLTETQWNDVKNADGWAVKDHVAHLAAWERTVIAFLSGQPRYDGLQVTAELWQTKDLDAINKAIFQRHQHEPLEQVQARFQSTHAELLRLVTPLNDEDLNQPYSHYLPGGDTPAIDVIYGDTANHYRQHQAWIEAMLAETSAEE
jgi:hypothetical protein